MAMLSGFMQSDLSSHMRIQIDDQTLPPNQLEVVKDSGVSWFKPKRPTSGARSFHKNLEYMSLGKTTLLVHSTREGLSALPDHMSIMAKPFQTLEIYGLRLETNYHCWLTLRNKEKSKPLLPELMFITMEKMAELLGTGHTRMV